MITLELKKRLIMRGYQEPVVTDIVSNFEINKPYVLGSCPSSGKTEMSIEAMIRLMESGKINRVLILAHSTNVLKENFYDRLCEYFHEGADIDIMRGQKDYNYNARIQVMIPQNIGHVIGKFDLIITDEAQHNVLAEDGNYSRIVEMVEPKFQLLLTGTPSKFVLENNLAANDNLELPYHINTVGMDMVGFEHFHNVRFDLIKSAYGFTNEDYNQSKDLYSDVNFSFEETERTVNNVIIGVVRNIALRGGVVLPKDADFVLEGRKLIQNGSFGKTLIMCRSIEQANQVSTIISKLFEVKVRVSQSKNDTDSSNLDKFKRNQFNFLCVVNRAREGYDDNKVVNLIDITMTHNIDLIYQMFCRVVRLDKSNPKPKLYVKVTSNAEGMPEYTMNIMTAALMLGATENLSAFNGRNFRGLVMPRVERIDDDDDDDAIVDGVVDIVDGVGNVVRRRQINDLMALDLIQMFTQDEENLISGNERYAMTTLGESLKLLSGEIDFYTDKKGYFNVIIMESITGSDGWRNKYKELSDRDGIKYNSNPWRFFNQSEKEFFDECYPNKIDFFSKKEGYFKLFKDNNINGSGTKWSKIYKELSDRDNVKYHSNPWDFYNQTIKEFFDECYPERIIYSDKEGYFKLFRDNNITGNGIWSQRFKELSDRDSLRYNSAPWKIFNQTSKEFFDECYPNRLYLTKQEYFEIFKTNLVFNSSDWSKSYKDLSKKNNTLYHSTPWKIFNQDAKQFFQECYPNKANDLTKDDYFYLFVENKINHSGDWNKNYRELSEINNITYLSTPWRKYKQSAKEFFNEYKEWLANKSNKYSPAYLGEFSEMNKTWNTTNSKNNHKRLNKDKSEWFKYHELYSNSRKKWNEIPYIELSKKIKDRPDWIVGDFGCGENLLSKEIKNKVHSFDHVAIDDSVKSCDLTDVPLHNNVLDVVVFSLSLMGTNYKEYFDEAYRVLRPMGVVFIAEPATRWEDREEELKGMLEASGFKLSGDIKHTDRFIYVDAIKY